MKIGIQTWGSTGDVNPFIALAAGLAAAGHEVTLAITGTERREYAEIGERLGFRVVQAGFVGASVEALNSIGKRLFAMRDPLAQMRMIFNEMFDPGAEAMLAAARKLCVENELVIGHFICHPLHLAAELSGTPHFTVSLHHGAIPTRFTAPHPLPNFGPWLNPWSWKLVGKLIDRVSLPSANHLRAAYGAAPLRSIRSAWESPLCNLIAVSRELCPPYPDWGENQRVCGFFDLPEAASDWQPSHELVAFLKAGEPPVYISFGSMMGLPQSSEELDETIALWCEAVKLAGCRAIIQTHWSEAKPVDEDAHIFRLESAAHARIFPHCAAVVHHGGAGTTQSATRAGCPSVVVAHIADQFFWGDQLHRLGLAPKPLLRKRLTAAKLARALREVLDSPGMRSRAAEIGARLVGENGVAEAVRVIENEGQGQNQPA